MLFHALRLLSNVTLAAVTCAFDETGLQVLLH